MGIEAKFSHDDVKKRFDRFLSEIEDMGIETLVELGEKCVMHARELPPEIGFNDQTGNLRSSIGYSVFKDGVAVHVNFKQVRLGGEGIKEGQKFANKLGSKYKEGIVLVVVAGMNYALALEANGAYKLKSRRPYDVLTSAELLAKQELPKMVAELKNNISKALE